MTTSKPHTISHSLGSAKNSVTNWERYCCPQGDRAVRSSTVVLWGGGTTATVFSSDPFGTAPQQTWLIELFIPLRPTSLSQYLAVIYILIVGRPNDCWFLPRSKLQAQNKVVGPRRWGREGNQCRQWWGSERETGANRGETNNKRRGPRLEALLFPLSLQSLPVNYSVLYTQPWIPRPPSSSLFAYSRTLAFIRNTKCAVRLLDCPH